MRELVHTVTIEVQGVEIRMASAYSLDIDLLQPADGFGLTVPLDARTVSLIPLDAQIDIRIGTHPQSVDWEVLNIAENGNTVLTERVDNFVLEDGKKLSLPVMGTMIIEDGKIKVWRDYFDLASFTSQMAG